MKSLTEALVVVQKLAKALAREAYEAGLRSVVSAPDKETIDREFDSWWKRRT